jgi:hypothetical protein
MINYAEHSKIHQESAMILANVSKSFGDSSEPAAKQRAFKRRVAYVLWATLGFAGAHRFWSRKPLTGLAQLALSLSGLGFLLAGSWAYVEKLLVDNAQMSYAPETAIMAVGLAMVLGVFAWVATDALRIKRWFAASKHPDEMIG